MATVELLSGIFEVPVRCIASVSPVMLPTPLVRVHFTRLVVLIRLERQRFRGQVPGLNTDRCLRHW